MVSSVPVGGMPEATITLRPARPREAASLTELCLRSKAHWGYDDAFIRACRAELTLTPEFLAEHLHRIAERDGAVVGYVEIESDEGEWYLNKLYVEPAHIGRGVGTILLDWAKEAARSPGANSLVIEADPNAVEFYRRHGARDAGTAPSGSIAGRLLPRLILEL
jgi:GNAT superfamily N-acetyltransferase